MAPSNLSEIRAANRPPHKPHELVSEILAQLPIRVLQRFKRICKSWRDTIFNDPRLLAPPPPAVQGAIAANRARDHVESRIRVRRELLHTFTHCDGLVLVPSETTVRVLNLATRRVLELPLSPCWVVSVGQQLDDFYRQQTFGLGHDPCSDTYKVVRLFRHSLDLLTMDSSHNHNLGAEVFSIGTDRQWRETAA
ncbi:unnamed protein product [Alopecurus aequalis]